MSTTAEGMFLRHIPYATGDEDHPESEIAISVFLEDEWKEIEIINEYSGNHIDDIPVTTLDGLIAALQELKGRLTK